MLNIRSNNNVKSSGKLMLQVASAMMMKHGSELQLLLFMDTPLRHVLRKVAESHAWEYVM